MNVRALLANKQILNKVGELLEVIAAEVKLYRKDLMRRYGRTERCIDQWLTNGTLPPPSSYSGRSPVWTIPDLEKHERKNPRLKKYLKK